MYVVACVGVFALAYLANIFVISIGYHRGLAHGSLAMSPLLRTIVLRAVAIGSRRVDPQAWVVMHRMHHAASDTQHDPHSPLQVGLRGMLRAQLRSYTSIIAALRAQEPWLRWYTRGLYLPDNPLMRGRRWLLPYVLQLAIFAALGLAVGWFFAGAYLVGILSHPLQGALVNGLGHAVGFRNFDTPDNSRNNHLVAWLILGEGYQNNHHRYPASATFAYAPGEVDLGFVAACVAEKLSLLTIDRCHHAAAKLTRRR